MAVMNGIFCLDANVIYKHKMLSVVTLELIIGTCNTPDTIVSESHVNGDDHRH